MVAKTQSKRRTPQQWHDLLCRYDSSTQTVAQFCKAHKISVGSFYSRRRQPEIKMADKEPPEAPLFVQIEPNRAKEQSAPLCWDVELDLGQGMILRINRPC